jgi:hypothetical protein
MSSSLDKLKALTSRLEGKLEEQGKVAKGTVETPKPTEDKVEEPKIIAIDTSSAAIKTPSVSQPKEIATTVREYNITRVKKLYKNLNIFEKSPYFSNIFIYKAMNLSGIGLKEEDFGEVREGKYIQIIAITYEPDKNGKKKAKNISLGYFGKAETLDPTLKNEIIEFVLRWRYEKAFQNVEHYKDLIARVK